MINDLMPPLGANGPAMRDQAFTLRDAPMRALLDSEIRYRRLFEAAQDGILLINAESGQIEDANPYLTKMLGYSHDELMGKKLWDVGAFADIDKSTGMFERLQAVGYVRYSDLPLRTKGGALISVEFVSNAYDCAGVRVIQCNIRNITEQRLAEDQVRKLSLVVEQSPVAIVIASLAGDIEYVNAALLRNSGYRQWELIGRPARTLQSAAMSPLTFADISASIGRGEIWRGEFRSQRKDGSEYDESAIVAPIRRANGTTSHCVTISEDITERKRDALELDRHRHALEALVDTRTQELAVAKRAAEAANIAKSAFLTNMSHEIRTPLSAIMGFTYLIRRTQVTEKQAAWLTQLDVAGKHLLELVNAILDLSKIEAGKLALEFTPVNAAGIAGSVVSILSERALAKQLKLVVDTHPLPQGLVGDASRLQQALLNYAGNAVKFTQAGSVTVRTLCVEETADTALLRFEVHDTGTGIAPEALERLFVPFEQVDSSITRQYGGTGLGLAIVRQLAHLMGGEAGARSTVGLGSTFWFTARLRKEPRPEAHDLFKAESPEAALLRDHAGARVLLVDDDAVNREFALELLHTVFDKVDFAKDGNEAVHMAGQCAYELILMDMQMPGLGGLEAARRIRRLPGGSDSVIVALTANAFAEDKAACLEAGMDDFHTKPVKVETLFETVLQGLRQHRQRLLPTHLGGAWSRG
jgi:two-component system sensor histidine kinase/response regulator